MSKKSAFSSQFKKGAYPQEPVDPGSPLNGHYVDSPSSIRKRQGVSLGSQMEARPGMVGKQGRNPKKMAKKRGR